MTGARPFPLVNAGRARWLGALCTGLLLVLAFPATDAGWLVWAALIPLLLAIDDARPGDAFWLGYASGVVFFGGLLEWIRLFGFLAWIMLTALSAIYLGAFAAGVRVLARERRGAVLWAVPLTWLAVEVVRSVGPLGFPWGLLGLSQYRSQEMRALASLVGTFGLSGLITLVNVTAAVLLRDRRITPGTAVAAIAILIAVFGGPRLRQDFSGPEHVVAAIQPNVPPMRKGDPLAASQLLSGLLDQTEQARRQGADLVVYPETAVPADLGSARHLRTSIAYRANGAIVIAGAFLSGPRNAAFVLDTSGEILGRYAKRRLVPFGEAGVRPGRSAAPVFTAPGTIGIVICYESAFTFMLRDLVARGASVIAILTNDGWFGVTAGPAQHAAHAVMRAAELGRSVVRAANTGSSMLIRPDGVVVASLPLQQDGVLAAALPFGGPLTPYVRWGWLLGPLAAAAWVIIATPRAVRALEGRPGGGNRLVTAVVAPALPLLVGRWAGLEEGALVWSVPLLMIAASAALARGRIFTPRRAPTTLLVSLVVTGVVIFAVRAAYARYGFSVPFGPPDGGWVAGGLRWLVAGVAMEVWLRGAVFAAARDLGGWPLAIAASTGLGVLLHLGAPQELLLWHLVSGLIFGGLRLWLRDAVGLGPARALGDLALGALVGIR